MYYVTKEEWAKILDAHYPDYVSNAIDDHEFEGKKCKAGEYCCFESILPGAPKDAGTTLVFEHIHFEIVDSLDANIGDIIHPDTYYKLKVGDVIKDLHLGVRWEVIEKDGDNCKLRSVAGGENGPFMGADPKNCSMIFQVLSLGEVA